MAAKAKLKEYNETISELAKERNELKDKIARYETVLDVIGESNVQMSETPEGEGTSEVTGAEGVRDRGEEEG